MFWMFGVRSDAPGADWRSAEPYAELLHCDRRFFAWEWLRRSAAYRQCWRRRDRLPRDAAAQMGLIAWIDPAIPAPRARPIWSVTTDPAVLDGRPAEPAPHAPHAGDSLDILTVAPLVSVEVTERAEHWLLSDGHWTIRLDLHDGTLLGGPLLIEHRLAGLRSLGPRLTALRHLATLAEKGDLPAALRPRERRAAQWILELRAADALLAGASQQDMARRLFGEMVAPGRWRLESTAYRLRIQRLVRRARERLAEPLAGPWFG
ncbi:transcriptional regulator domain-containing protein [Sphingopyxis sp. LARHCG72]